MNKCWLQLLIAVIELLILCSGCRDTELIVPNDTTQSWKSVNELARLDVRYILRQNNQLFLAAIDPAVISVCDSGRCHFEAERGLIYKTMDAMTWTKVRGFFSNIGPLTFHNDTLYCLASDSIHRMRPDGTWETAFATPPRLGDATADGDMIFIRDTLYAMQTLYGNAVETYRIHPDGTFEEVAGPDGLLHYAGAKYIKTTAGGLETVYLRPHWLAGGFFAFDGYQYTHIEQGLTPGELLESPSDAMATDGDSLLAGFGGIPGTVPGSIKLLVCNHWRQVHDTIPSSHSAYLVSPTLYAEPTAITFLGSRMFVATNSQGVLEWDDVRGWTRRSDGLKPGYLPGLNEPDLKYPVPFLTSINGVLVAAYGRPGYAPWGEVGVYTLKLR